MQLSQTYWQHLGQQYKIDEQHSIVPLFIALKPRNSSKIRVQDIAQLAQSVANSLQGWNAQLKTTDSTGPLSIVLERFRMVDMAAVDAFQLAAWNNAGHRFKTSHSAGEMALLARARSFTTAKQVRNLHFQVPGVGVHLRIPRHLEVPLPVLGAQLVHTLGAGLKDTPWTVIRAMSMPEFPAHFCQTLFESLDGLIKNRAWDEVDVNVKTELAMDWYLEVSGYRAGKLQEVLSLELSFSLTASQLDELIARLRGTNKHLNIQSSTRGQLSVATQPRKRAYASMALNGRLLVNEHRLQGTREIPGVRPQMVLLDSPEDSQSERQPIDELPLNTLMAKLDLSDSEVRLAMQALTQLSDTPLPLVALNLGVDFLVAALSKIGWAVPALNAQPSGWLSRTAQMGRGQGVLVSMTPAHWLSLAHPAVAGDPRHQTTHLREFAQLTYLHFNKATPIDLADRGIQHGLCEIVFLQGCFVSNSNHTLTITPVFSRERQFRNLWNPDQIAQHFAIEISPNTQNEFRLSQVQTQLSKMAWRPLPHTWGEAAMRVFVALSRANRADCGLQRIEVPKEVETTLEGSPTLTKFEAAANPTRSLSAYPMRNFIEGIHGESRTLSGN